MFSILNAILSSEIEFSYVLHLFWWCFPVEFSQTFPYLWSRIQRLRIVGNLRFLFSDNTDHADPATVQNILFDKILQSGMPIASLEGAATAQCCSFFFCHTPAWPQKFTSSLNRTHNFKQGTFGLKKEPSKNKMHFSKPNCTFLKSK